MPEANPFGGTADRAESAGSTFCHDFTGGEVKSPVGLNGEPLIDTNGDGRITLGELAVEVREAMKHREGQQDGFTTKGIGDDFVMAKTPGTRPTAKDAKFPLGSYVMAADKGQSRPGRVMEV